MKLEIERKFLVKGNNWQKGYKKQLIIQGYLHLEHDYTVRVRQIDEQGFITIKAIDKGIAKKEFEYEIPLEEAQQLLKLCKTTLIEKYRYSVETNGFMWEVDEFLGKNSGLVIAEVELEQVDQIINIPEWIGNEVTGDRRYYNAHLSVNPFLMWPKD